MRLMMGAVLAGLLLAAPAVAQETPAAPAAPAASACGAVPPAPAGMPDGASATAAQVNAYNTAFTAWGQAAQAPLLCRRQEAEEAQTRSTSLSAQFNADATAARTSQEAWQAEAAEFTARQRR